MPFYKGYKHPPESRLKMRLAKLGRPMPEETKTKIGLSNRGKVISLEQIEKISMAHKGVKLSDAHVQSICIAQRKRWASGEVCWAQGKTFSEQHKKRLSIAHIGKHSRKKIFKGTRSQYTALHVWVKNRLSKVQCEHCFTSERLQYANKRDR